MALTKVTYSMIDGANVNVTDYGAVANGLTDDTVAIQTAIDSATTGSCVVFPSGSYKITDAIVVDKAITLQACGAVTLTQFTAGKSAILVESGDVTVDGFTVIGLQYAAHNATENGIYAYGADANNYINNINIENNNVSNFGNAGITLLFVNDFTIGQNKVSNCFAAGIQGLSVSEGTIINNTVDSIIGDGTVGGGLGGVYGVHLSKNNGSVAVYPTTKNVTVISNIVKNCTKWEGFDSHAGAGIKFIGNTSIDNMYGIVLTRYSSGGLDIGPINCVIQGNVITNNTIAQSAVRNGIQLVGALLDYGSNNIVNGNTIYNYGSNASDETSASIYVLAQVNCIVSENIITNTGANGIRLDYIGNNVNVTNNNLYYSALATCVGLYLRGHGGAATGRIAGNIMYNIAKGVYWYDNVSMQFENNQFISVPTIYDQNGGTFACEYAVSRMINLYSGTDTSWNPSSIANGASESHTISNVPGCSSLATATVGLNRTLQGMTLSVVTGDTDTNKGTITLTLNNNTGGAIDLAALTIRYSISKYV